MSFSQLEGGFVDVSVIGIPSGTARLLVTARLDDGKIYLERGRSPHFEGTEFSGHACGGQEAQTSDLTWVRGCQTKRDRLAGFKRLAKGGWQKGSPPKNGFVECGDGDNTVGTYVCICCSVPWLV